jgi:uridylate kinase
MGGGSKAGIDAAFLEHTAKELKDAKQKLPRIQIALVVGGGNFIRGSALKGEAIERVTADYMGMLATVMNAMALHDTLEHHGIACRVLTAFGVGPVGETFVRREAVRHLEEGRVVIFAGGTGNPYFSTDTAAVLRALEIGAQAVLKGTKVDGVYDKDPARARDAVRYEELSFEEALERKLGVMDATAFALCMERRIPLVVYNALRAGNLSAVVEGRRIGTIVR